MSEDEPSISARRSFGDVLYAFIFDDTSNLPFWPRFGAMLLGGIVFHVFLVFIGSISLLEKILIYPWLLYTVPILLGFNAIVYVVICYFESPRGRLPGYFAFGVLIPGGTYLLAAGLLSAVRETLITAQ